MTWASHGYGTFQHHLNFILKADRQVGGCLMKEPLKPVNVQITLVAIYESVFSYNWCECHCIFYCVPEIKIALCLLYWCWSTNKKGPVWTLLLLIIFILNRSMSYWYKQQTVLSAVAQSFYFAHDVTASEIRVGVGFMVCCDLPGVSWGCSGWTCCLQEVWCSLSLCLPPASLPSPHKAFTPHMLLCSSLLHDSLKVVMLLLWLLSWVV